MKNLLHASALALPVAIFAVATAPSVAADTGPAHRTRTGGHRSVTELGRRVTKTAGLTMSLSRTLEGVAATCGSAVHKAVPAAGPLIGIPVAPTTDYKVPMHDPSAVILMNKQIRDPFGGMTSTGMSLDAAPGTPDAVPRTLSGVANCDAVGRVGGVAGAAIERARLQAIRYPVTSLAVPGLG